MKMLPISAAMKAPTRMSLTLSTAAAVPTSTGAIAAGSVRGRAAINQSLIVASGSPRVLAEVGLAALRVGVAALLALLRHVEEQRRVVGELLKAGEPVLVRVEARLQQPQGERREGIHLAAPRHRLPLEVLDRDHRIHQPHLQGLLRRVEAQEKPDLLRLLDPDVAREEARAEAAVEAADARPGLAESRIIAGDRQVADQVEDVSAADGVPRDHRDHGLRQAADLDVEVAHVEPADTMLRDLVVTDVAVVAPDALVAAGAERLGSGARK